MGRPGGHGQQGLPGGASAHWGDKGPCDRDGVLGREHTEIIKQQGPGAGLTNCTDDKPSGRGQGRKGLEGVRVGVGKGPGRKRDGGLMVPGGAAVSAAGRRRRNLVSALGENGRAVPRGVGAQAGHGVQADAHTGPGLPAQMMPDCGSRFCVIFQGGNGAGVYRRN